MSNLLKHENNMVFYSFANLVKHFVAQTQTNKQILRQETKFELSFNGNHARCLALIE